MAERPLYTLYKNLKAQNYDVPDDYNKFESALTRDGKGGADNRHAIYENLKAQNFDVPSTYERFYSALFEPRSKTSSRAKGGSVPMSAADRARFLSGAQSVLNTARQVKRASGNIRKTVERAKKFNANDGKVTIGFKNPLQNQNVQKNEFNYNSTTGKTGTYTTTDGVEFDNEYDAAQYQNKLDKYGEEWSNAVDMGIVPSELDKADPDLSDTDVAMRQMERRQEWLNENQDRRSKELNESMHLQGSPFVASGGAVAPSSFNTAISNEANRLSDVEYGAYNTAKAYNQMLRTTLLQELKEQKQRNENAGWWKDKWNDVSNYFGAMFNTMLDPKLYSQGVMDAAISNNLLQVKKGMEDGTIKKGSNAGNAAQAMLGAIQQQQGEAAKQQQYGTKAYLYGDISGRSLKFWGDFALSGWRNVMTTGFTKAGEKVGEKMALGALGKWFTKNTGRVLGDIAGSAALAATNQLGSTYNNVIERYVGMNNENGGVTQDKNGDLKFNEGVSLGKAIKDGFGSATIENFSEMFGEYLPGAPKLLSKLGLSKVSSFFEKIGNNAYYKWLSNATNKSGIQGVMAEISEEEFGTALHAAWGDGDGSWSDFNVFTNPDAREKQIDTCLGMFYAVGFMQAPRTAVGAINAVQYFNIKHQVAKADKFGQMMFNDKWDEIKSKIDVTTNADLTKTVLDATRSDSMTAKQKGAVINYAMFLSKLRGFNQAADAKTKDKVEEGDTAPTLSNDLDDAYTEGHNADDSDKHNIQLEQNDKANELAAMLHITPEQLHDMADEDLETMTGQDDKLDQAIYDYQVSTAKYQGVMDGAQDEVDMAAHQAAMETDNMTDLSRGTVRKATIKATGGLEDYEVYIISGNIATHDDGSIDVGNSDDMIIYYDPTTGRKEHADAMMFADLIEELPAADVKAQAIIDAKENAIKNIAGIIDGTVEVGSQFSVTDADGTEHTYEVLADNGDGTAMITIDGNVPTELVKGENVNIPVSFTELQKMKDESDQQRLQAAKAQREQMEKERAEQQMQAQTTQAENLAEESNTQSAPIEDNLDYSDIIRKDGKVQMVDVSDKDGNNLFPDAKDVFYIQGNKMRTKFAYIDANGELKTQSFPTGLVKIKTRGEVSVDDYKKYRNMILSAESSAMPETSMIEDNSGTIEADRGGIEVEDNTQPLSEADADNVIAQMELSAETAPDLELTPDNWTAEFGEDGILSTPIGDVKMGENQVAKLFEKGRSKEFGMIKPTLTNPDVIIEVPSHSADGNEERSSSYLFIKTFLGKNGKKVYYFKSVTIKKDGLEISISSHYDRAKRVKEALMKGKLLYRKNDGAQTEQNQPSASVTTSQEDAAGSSESKDTNISSNGNENNESLTFEDGTPIPVDMNGEVDLSQTDASHAAEWYDNNLGEDADDWLDGEIKKAKKVLEQAKNKKLAGTKPSELVASKKEKEAAIADAQAHYDSAISIRDSLKKRRIAKEENTSEGRRNLIEKARRKFARLKSAVNNDAEAVSQFYRDTIGSLLHRLYDGTGIDVTDTTPLTAEEYVASNLGAHSLNYEGTETSKGVKQETGLSREDFAKTQLLAADGKGTTIDALVHSLWENRPSNLESLDTQEIRNALIGVLNSGFKASEARNFVENIRIAQAENILEEQKRAQENAAYAEQHKAEPEAELEAKSDEKAELKAKSEAKLDNESDNKSNDLSNESDNEKINDNINDNINTPEVPEDATDEKPLGEQRTKSPFLVRENGKQQTETESDADIEKNKVDDIKVVDNIVGKKTRKTLEKIAKIMGANIQWLYSNKQFNGRFDEKTNTIYLTLDSSITEGVQFIFGHEMTHEMRTKNPAVYDELKTLVKDMMGEDAFNSETDNMQKRYKKGGARYWNDRNAIEEEVVADQLGIWIRDANYAHTLLLKMSHPLLARLHEIVNSFLMALHGTEFSDDMNLILRSIEQAYVKTAKGEITNSETGEDVSFSLRQKPEPKKKGIGYKVFVLKDGKLYPPMVANPDGAATPVGVWLDADAAPIAGESKTGRPQVKQGGKGTQGGSGKLAYRPGWHLGVVPYAIQFNRKDAEGNKTLFPKNFVFAEVEYAADVDYQDEARQEGINPSGKYQHSLAGLKHLPTDGYYMYRTNPNPETDPWVITGAMKVNRILTRAEQAELVKNAGREPQQIQEGDIVTDDVVNSINQEIADASKFSIKTYHGSQASFDKFDHSFMGSGEGAQAYGWGTYVSEVEGIAKAYAKQNAAKHGMPRDYKIAQLHLNHAKFEYDKVQRAYDNSKAYIDSLKEDLQNYRESMARRKEKVAYFAQNNMPETVDKLLKQIKRAEDTIKVTENDINMRTKELEGWKPKLEEVKKKYEEEQKKFNAIPKPQIERNLYSVDIPDDTGENYLGWDEKMTPRMRDIRKEILEDNGYKLVDSDDMRDYFEDRDGKEYELFKEQYKTGGTFYEELAQLLHSQKLASLALKEYGFDGVKVIAERNTGGNKEGKMNYVIFDENNAQITSHTKFSLRLKSAIDETEINPSDAQKESGNYKKGHIKFGGYDYTIENPKGSTRSGKDADGKEWKVTMHDTYGYIRGKFGKDGDHLDMFINDKADLDNWNGDVFVVDQVNPDGSFDEHKVMYGYDSMDDAKKAYLANYSDGWQGLGNITGASKDEFDKWLDTSNRKLKPFADYAKVKFSLKDEKTLAGVHNISEEKLLKAIKQGGLANPSVAVIDSSKQDHKAYGDISLILPSDKIAKRTGKNAGTWQGDAYTPIYPEVEKQMSNKGAEKSSSDVLSVSKEMQHEVRNGIDRWLNGGDANSGLKYLFLHEKGNAPKMVELQHKYSDKVYNDLKFITAGDFDISSIGKADTQKVLDMYIDNVFGGDRAAYDEKQKYRILRYKKQVAEGEKNPFLLARAKSALEQYDKYGFYFDKVQEFVRKVERDHRMTGVNTDATLNEVEDYIKTNNLTDEFNTWLEGKEKEYGVKEVIFDGFTPSGNRRYVPNTLENVSKIMKKQGRNGATGSAVSFQNFAARLMPSYGTLKDIRSKKGLLTSDREKFDKFREKWSNVFFELGMKCQPDATGTFDDYGLARLSEAAMTSDPQAYLKKEYNVDFSDEDTKRLKEMVKAIKEEQPAMYFETKFERPVGFNEFSSAVVPTTASNEVKQALQNAGVQIYEYDKEKEGDRKRAFNEAINSSDNIRFSLAGERGAAAADKAEERTARMDNLSVARKMEEEKKDAKAIKIATGWERGADGKWRFEIPDFHFNYEKWKDNNKELLDYMADKDYRNIMRYEKEFYEDLSPTRKKNFDELRSRTGYKIKQELTLGDVLEGKGADTLFKYYPELRDVKFKFSNLGTATVGSYDSKTKTIEVNEALLYSPQKAEWNLQHEVQHVIQHLEGFAKGGNQYQVRGEVKKRFEEVTKQIKQLRAEGKEDEAKALIEKNRGLYNAYMKNDDFDSYKSLAGEVEARNVQERMNMTPEERRKSLAESTEDVARKDQIFLGVGDVSFSLRDMADGKESGAADMAEDLKSLNTPDEVDDAIKTAIDDMPSGWKMANKKMIHVAQALGENRKAEIAGEEPKFSLKDGTLIKAGTYFSGGGLVEEGLKGIIDPVVAVEYDEKISGVYRNNFGQHIVTADVRDVDPKELVKQIDGEVEYFHASPVCKNYSQAKSNHAEVELDKETAASTAEFINAIKPKVVTIENVKGYKDSDAMKTITDALDANGYTWDADVYNAADYGGYTNRERLIVRAVRDGKLPEKPKKMARKSGWYEAVADIIPTLTEKKNGVAPWMDIRLKADGIDWRNIDKPLYVMGSAYADGKIPHAFADELLPTLRTKSGDVIVMPDGKVYRAMGRVLARVSGVSDDYKMPFSENLSHTIIGNGIPTQLTEHVIAPLLQNTLHPTTPEDGNTKFSLRGSTPYGKQMEEWMEKNHLEKGAVPMEKPIMKEGENIFDYANRMVEWTRNQNLWKTAPKQTGFQDALDKWKADNGLSPDAYPPVRPHRENYSTEIGYAEDLEEYNKKKELWKSAPKPKDFDLSVDLEDMNKQLRNIRRAVLNQKDYDQRTVKAVSDLVRKMLNIGWGDGLSRGKVGNLLSAAKNATGANDVKKYLDKAMGILAENYLNRLSTAYDNLINTKGARADQSGVIKMGSLDAKGQAFMSEYKKAINMDDKSLDSYIANIEEDSAKNEDNVEMNDYRLAGIQAAIMYKQQIGGNDADIAELKRQIGELKNKKDATKEDKDLLKSLEKKLFENKFDRITMYENLLNNIQRMVKESKGRAKEFREEIAEHKNEILHRANLDLEGVDSTYYDTTTAKKKFVNNDLQRAVFSSTYTFEQFLKFFGKHSANGEGRLYNYFHKLNQDALDEEQLYNEMNRNALDEKTKELFGKNKFMNLVGIDGKGMKEMDVEVTDYSNKETGKRTIHLKQGQMLYIYLVNKETDGEMKLRAMGITEEDVAAIEENLDQRVKAMGEWLQDEYLPECQRRYQATHTKYFGAPMKEVENYFPLAINNRARNVKEDVNQDSDAMSQLAGTSTGAIVTRRVNVIPLDIENADAFEVAFNHLQEMEEWSAMLPFRQDINTLLSYTHFRNQVQNMSSVAYGSGKTLWDEFKQTAQIAAGTYKPKVNAGMMDSRIAAAMGGIAVAKISGRLWTAIKQSQSATVFLPECDFTRFVKNGVNPYGSWKWAMENIPDFRKRVENMTYGDVKLRQYLDELEKWHDWTKTISKIGMAPNILVDGITCAVGARSVYETEVNRLTKLGYPKEKAEEKAYYKSVAAYNKTQQSSGGMYLSPMQVDRTYVSAALSLFKNANYAYGRMQIEACRGLARTYDFWGGKHKTTLIESMTRQIMEEDGLDENTARTIAKATYNRTFRQSIGRLINFVTLVPVSWALYKVLPYLLTGDDDDKKKDMIEEAVLKGFATSLSDNYVIPFASNILNAGLKVEDGKPTFDPEVFRYQNLYINPATSDLANIYSMVGNQKWYSVANKLGMLGVQSLIGFNPETVGALYQAFAEADYDNGNTAKEWQIGILKAISAPEESIRELYMDELGLKSEDIKKIPLAELEKRYAERQINRDNLLSQIVMDAETFNGYVDKYQKSFEKKIKDKMDKWDEYDKKKADEFFDTTSDPKLKDMIEKKRTKDANAAADEQIAKEGLNQEKKGKEPSEEAYDAVKMSIDVAEDNAISTYNKVLNKRYAALNDEYNEQTDAMKYIFMSKHPNFKAYKDLESEYTTYGKKMKELKEKLASADGYDAKQTILKQIRAEREKFSELQSKVR